MASNCRLYLVSPPRIDDLAGFVEEFKAALDGGDVACFQLRLKTENGPASDDEIIEATQLLLPIARKQEVAFLINDRPDLAAKTRADGVHIGQSDGSIEAAREVLGDDATVGVTCHDSKHLALIAGEGGADYVAFGAFFPTDTKEAPTRAEPDILEWWSYATTVPSVAIGGITAENCAPLVRAGADFLAVSGSVWRHKDGPGVGVKELNDAISSSAA